MIKLKEVVVTMNELRRFCADSPYGKENCPYAKVVEEEGKFPVTIESVMTDANGSKKYKTENCVENFRYAVYCTCQDNKFVGTVEPYGGICNIPNDCPDLHNNSKVTFLGWIKSLIK